MNDSTKDVTDDVRRYRRQEWMKKVLPRIIEIIILAIILGEVAYLFTR